MPTKNQPPASQKPTSFCSVGENQPKSISRSFVVGNAKVIQGAFLAIIENGAIAITDGKIVDVGPTPSIKAKYSNFEFWDAEGNIILPGLINSHTHAPLGFFRGLGHGKTDMIETFLFPAEKNLTAELTEPLSYSYILDGLRSGVTSFVDHYYFSHGVAKAIERFGARGWVGETIADLGGAFPGEESWKRATQLIESSQFSSLIRYCIAPHAADTVSSSLLRRCADYARANRIPLHMHLSQSTGEFERVHKRDGSSPVRAAEKAGALGENSLVVHLTSANSEDLKIIKNSGATLGYCPASTILYDRLADIKLIHSLKIPMAIGTDCAASNDSADCLTELKIAGLIARHEKISNEEISPDHLLSMATTIPANALGVSKELGTLEKGKLADLIIMSSRVSGLPCQNVLANIIYSMGSRDVTHVMVDGKWRLWNGQLVGVDESTIKDDYVMAVAEISRRITAR